MKNQLQSKNSLRAWRTPPRKIKGRVVREGGGFMSICSGCPFYDLPWFPARCARYRAQALASCFGAHPFLVAL
eukprot:2488525-Amphidinium_carterae.1